MIKEKGGFVVQHGRIDTQEMSASLHRLPDGDYEYWLIGQGKLPLLPQLKYLNGIVLKTISDSLPEHPSVGALYRYFEKLYAPVRSCQINGDTFEYRDLKSEKSVEMDDVISLIVHHAKVVWGINIPGRGEVSEAGDREPYMDAYYDDWKRISTLIHH